MSQPYGCWSTLTLEEKKSCFDANRKPKLLEYARRKVLHAYRPLGQVRAEWINEVLPQINKLTVEDDNFWYGISRGKPIQTILWHLYLVGETSDVSCLQPTIVAECIDKKTAQISCNTLKSLKPALGLLLDNYQIHYSEKKIALRSHSNDDEEGAEEEESSDLRLPSRPSLCGSQAILHSTIPDAAETSMSRVMTIGGTVIVDGRYYAMTAAHAFTQAGHSVAIKEEDTCPDDIVTGNQTNRKKHHLADIPSDTAVVSTTAADKPVRRCLGKVYVHDCDASLINPNDCSSAIHRFNEDSLLNGQSSSVLLNQDKDWALIPIENDRFHVPNEYESAEGKRNPVTGIAGKMPSGTVTAVTGVSPCTETSFSIQSMILLPNSKRPQIVWVADMQTAPGDCGSWLIDNQGKACAMIVAACEEDNEAFCLPLVPIFESIQNSLKVSVGPSVKSNHVKSPSSSEVSAGDHIDTNFPSLSTDVQESLKIMEQDHASRSSHMQTSDTHDRDLRPARISTAVPCGTSPSQWSTAVPRLYHDIPDVSLLSEDLPNKRQKFSHQSLLHSNCPEAGTDGSEQSPHVKLPLTYQINFQAITELGHHYHVEKDMVFIFVARLTDVEITRILSKPSSTHIDCVGNDPGCDRQNTSLNLVTDEVAQNRHRTGQITNVSKTAETPDSKSAVSERDCKGSNAVCISRLCNRCQEFSAIRHEQSMPNQVASGASDWSDGNSDSMSDGEELEDERTGSTYVDSSICNRDAEKARRTSYTASTQRTSSRSALCATEACRRDRKHPSETARENDGTSISGQAMLQQSERPKNALPAHENGERAEIPVRQGEGFGSVPDCPSLPPRCRCSVKRDLEEKLKIAHNLRSHSHLRERRQLPALRSEPQTEATRYTIADQPSSITKHSPTSNIDPSSESRMYKEKYKKHSVAFGHGSGYSDKLLSIGDRLNTTHPKICSGYSIPFLRQITSHADWSQDPDRVDFSQLRPAAIEKDATAEKLSQRRDRNPKFEKADPMTPDQYAGDHRFIYEREGTLICINGYLTKHEADLILAVSLRERESRHESAKIFDSVNAATDGASFQHPAESGGNDNRRPSVLPQPINNICGTPATRADIGRRQSRYDDQGRLLPVLPMPP